MALPLRPIDNALPNPPERPKKQAKVAAPIQKQSELSLNDENKAPLPASADATTDYIFSENLKPIPDPDTKIEVNFFFFVLVNLKFGKITKSP